MENITKKWIGGFEYTIYDITHENNNKGTRDIRFAKFFELLTKNESDTYEKNIVKNKWSSYVDVFDQIMIVSNAGKKCVCGNKTGHHFFPVVNFDQKIIVNNIGGDCHKKITGENVMSASDLNKIVDVFKKIKNGTELNNADIMIVLRKKLTYFVDDVDVLLEYRTEYEKRKEIEKLEKERYEKELKDKKLTEEMEKMEKEKELEKMKEDELNKRIADGKCIQYMLDANRYCKVSSEKNSKYCKYHPIKLKCTATKKDGSPCFAKGEIVDGFCIFHTKDKSKYSNCSMCGEKFFTSTTKSRYCKDCSEDCLV
jgi:hypothetical protein